MPPGGSGLRGVGVRLQVVREPPRVPRPCPPGVIDGSGPPVGPSVGKSASSAREMLTPSRTRAAAALRLAGVIRLVVPAAAASPHLPQLDNSSIIRSTAALLMFLGYFSD